MRIPTSLVTLIATFLCIQSVGLAQQAPIQLDDAALTKRAQDAIDLVSPAIVRFSYGKNATNPFGCGAIVSPDGHVAVSGPVHAVTDNGLLELRLSNGRVVRGEALGWSGEFGFGLLRITEPGPWPHVAINRRPFLGQLCIALGYPRNTDLAAANHPDIRLGLVTRISPGSWLTTSHRSEFNAHPVFDLSGELLGLNCSSPVGGDPIHAFAALITDHWDDFVAGKNLDRERLFPKEEQQSYRKGQGITDAALKMAKAASVRIGNAPDDKSVTIASGTIVTADGYIITCGHHERMPGDKLQVSLRDGRTATAIVLDTNLVCDIGILKTIDDGPWPHVAMGSSARCRPGSPCLLLGYPKARRDQDTWVFRTQIIKPTQTLIRRDDWYDEFWTESYPECKGASGGGVFDVDGKIVGIILGGAGQEMMHARVELFQKNWDTLIANKHFQVLEASSIKESSGQLSRIEQSLSAK